MKAKKLYDFYLANRTTLSDYQMCCAYTRLGNVKIGSVCEKILLETYPTFRNRNALKRAVNASLGSPMATIEVRELGLCETKADILSHYVRKKFNLMVADMSQGTEGYPIELRQAKDEFEDYERMMRGTS